MVLGSLFMTRKILIIRGAVMYNDLLKERFKNENFPTISMSRITIKQIEEAFTRFSPHAVVYLYYADDHILLFSDNRKTITNISIKGITYIEEPKLCAYNAIESVINVSEDISKISVEIFVRLLLNS